MRYRSLVIENFGPYYGTHELEFRAEQGVWIVYGDNGRGKTTLLNAFRFALYGKVLGRRSERPLGELANRRHVKESDQKEFSTTLALEHDGDAYRVTRHYREGRNPATELIVERNGTPLNSDDGTATMRRLAPESISQFFLFDGELLRQYEDLRDPNGDSGKQMREEVDRLLGVHALRNTISDLKELSVAINAEQAKVISAEKKDENLGVAMQEATDIRIHLADQMRELDGMKADNTRKLTHVEDQMVEHERAGALLAEMKTVQRRVEELRTRKKDALDALHEVGEHAWRVALGPTIEGRRKGLLESVENVRERHTDALVAHRVAHHLDDSSACPVCHTELEEQQRADLLAEASRTDADEELARLDEDLRHLQAQSATLEAVIQQSPGEVLGEREKTLRDIDLDIADQVSEIEDIEAQLAGVDQQEVHKLQKERDALKALIANSEIQIDETIDRLKAQDESIAKLKGERERLNVKLDPVLEAKDKVVAELLELFQAADSEYQLNLLTSVEEQASELFRSVRAESDYARLRIRDGYALSIVDAEGSEIAGHSAGYEHLVALSLISALQRCSPIQGPIVMDSPFGRLDEAHTRNVVAALPKIADQVVLLAFKGEFDNETAASALGSTLMAEYSLERVGAQETLLVEGTSP